MQAILAVTIPFFALVLLGWFAARSYWLPESAIPGLNTYVLFFALPCMLFRFGASLPFDRLADPVLLAVYVVAALAIIALTIAVTVQRAGRPGGVTCATRPSARSSPRSRTPASWACRCWSRCSATPRGPVIGAIVATSSSPSTVCVAIAQVEQAIAPCRRRDRSLAAGGALAAQRAHQPAAVGDRPRRRLRATDRELPAPLAQIVRMLGDSAAPVALFTIGSVLWRAGSTSHTRTPVAHYLPVALIKLLVHPALVLAIGSAAIALGAGSRRSR
jgi:hypothetical protein